MRRTPCPNGVASYASRVEKQICLNATASTAEGYLACIELVFARQGKGDASEQLRIVQCPGRFDAKPDGPAWAARRAGAAPNEMAAGRD